ncbi:hypothetical protein [Streptomyces sp. OE57]|uniref:hypothetical protein n=1 Tax=Streptomyces lacaronensis TaxID=3379885 RepID=UPI0039B78110
MWHRATVGLAGALPDRPRLVRHSAAALVEWMSAKDVHPAGAVLADRYYIESLSDLYLRCFVAGAKRLAEHGGRAATGGAGGSSEGEGASGRHRRVGREG